MTEGFKPGIEIKATHFGPKGEVLFNPPKEQPKPEKKGLFDFLKKQHTELQKPEGPKHVLEAVQERDLINRTRTTGQEMSKLGEHGAQFYSLDDLGGVCLDTIAQFRAQRGERATFVETPAEMTSILNALQVGEGKPDEISKISLFSRSVQIISRDGTMIYLSLPNENKPADDPENKIHFIVDAPKDSGEGVQERLKTIEEKYSQKESLLTLADEMVSYTEAIAAKLPEEIRLWNEQEARVREQEKTAAEHKRLGLTPGERKAWGELRARHPDNPLFTTDFKEVPAHYVSVYKLINEEKLAEAAHAGLHVVTTERTMADLAEQLSDKTKTIEGKEVDLTAAQQHIIERQQVFNRYAPEGYSRSAIYATPTYGDLVVSSQVGEALASIGNVVLEIKVDPSKVRVASMMDFEDFSTREGGPEENVAIERYWKRSRTLKEYIKNPVDDRLDPDYLLRPEVLIPEDVDRKFIKVVSALPR